MRTPTLTPGDERQDRKIDPGQEHYDGLFNDIVNQEREGNYNDQAFNDIAENYDKSTADDAQENANINKVRDQEQGGNTPPANWSTNVTKNNNPAKAVGKAWFKKRGPLMGMGGGLGIVGVVISLMTGSSAMLLPNITQNATVKNDARGTLLERRMVRALNHKMNNTSGPCDTKLAACRAGKMPMSMLDAMKKRGIVAYNGNTAFPIEGNGYTGTNPTHYDIPDGKGGTKKITAAEFMGEYKNNPTFRKGLKRAYNMRYLGYSGVYMLNNFFNKLGVKKDGGAASNSSTITEATADAELEKRLAPTTEVTADSSRKTIRDRIRALLDRSSKRLKRSPDPILTAGTAMCLVINAPTFVADSYRSLQAIQLAILLSDFVLSPSGIQQAGAASPEKISAIGKLLTDRKVNADGSFGRSALDSKILLSAMGVNKSPTGVSKYAPGYSLLRNPVIQGFGTASASTKSACNQINTPQAVVASMVVQAGIGTATAGIGTAALQLIKGLFVLGATIGIVDKAIEVLDSTGAIDGLANLSYEAVKDVIGNYTTGAKHEELGDALGTAIYSFYPSAALAGGAAVLNTSQVEGFTNVMASAENEIREEDIATLSPFDISSPYTFTGSIVSNYTLSGALSQNLFQTSLSTLGYLISSPLKVLSNNTSAESSVALQDCSYASAFGVDDTVAVNAAGYPCVGIPNTYLDMSSDEVMRIVADDIDTETGAPKEDSDINIMMADCSAGELGSIAGCTIGTSSLDSSDQGGSSFDERKRAAQSLYMLDYQVESILSGEDSVASSEETFSSILAYEDYDSILDELMGGLYFNDLVNESTYQEAEEAQGIQNKIVVNNTCEQPVVGYPAAFIGGILSRLRIV